MICDLCFCVNPIGGQSRFAIDAEVEALAKAEDTKEVWPDSAVAARSDQHDSGWVDADADARVVVHARPAEKVWFVAKCVTGVLVCGVLWRPDVLVFWGTGCGVRTPSLATYKKQQALAKRARQAAASGVVNSSSNDHGSRFGSQSSYGSFVSAYSRTGSGRGGVHVALRNTTTLASARNHAHAAGGSSSSIASGGSVVLNHPAVSSSPLLSWVWHLLKQCWWARWCFVGSSVRQLLFSR